jgi:hypothetical protein
MEKLPMLGLSIASSVVTIATQHRTGATATAEAVPYSARLGNAFLALAAYLRKMVWPADLAVFYPHPGTSTTGLPPGSLLLAIMVVLGISGVVAYQAQRRPWLLVGWCWYLVTLLPVIGIVQVGRQGMADRYTYIPLIGISMALAWLIPQGWSSTSVRLSVPTGLAALFIGLAVTARAQTRHWRDSLSLFEHATRVTEANWLAWKNIGAIQHREGQPRLAVEAFQRAAAARPQDPDIWFDLGVEHFSLDEHVAAAECFRRAVLYAPRDEEAWFRLGVTQALLGDRAGVVAVIQRLQSFGPEKARELEQTVNRIARQAGGT